ncbi:hypothetical protein BDR04DRAFT_1097771 [Suillus decipiens]|nr:hypothetical protein BDR04DRAFT_1097771 [Suillus decipiens]
MAPTENWIIASEEGKKFGVRWKCLTQQSSGVQSVVSFDGVHCSRQAMPPRWIDAQERKSIARRDSISSKIEFTVQVNF